VAFTVAYAWAKDAAFDSCTLPTQPEKFMGVLYYAVSHTRKEIVFLNKWSLVLDTDNDGNRVLNLSDEILRSSDGYPHETYWRAFVEKLRAFQTDAILDDSSDTVDETCGSYVIVGSRFESDSKYFGLTLEQYYDR
jgi:hypothetical protein